jgi:hypothetical protein
MMAAANGSVWRGLLKTIIQNPIIEHAAILTMGSSNDNSTMTASENTDEEIAMIMASEAVSAESGSTTASDTAQGALSAKQWAILCRFLMGQCTPVEYMWDEVCSLADRQFLRGNGRCARSRFLLTLEATWSRTVIVKRITRNEEGVSELCIHKSGLLPRLLGEWEVSVRFIGAYAAHVERKVYFVLSYTPGMDLFNLFANRDITLAIWLRLACFLCRTLATLHAAHIMHGDVKPDNVIVRGSSVVTAKDMDALARDCVGGFELIDWQWAGRTNYDGEEQEPFATLTAQSPPEDGIANAKRSLVDDIWANASGYKYWPPLEVYGVGGGGGKPGQWSDVTEHQCQCVDLWGCAVTLLEVADMNLLFSHGAKPYGVEELAEACRVTPLFDGFAGGAEIAETLVSLAKGVASAREAYNVFSKICGCD